ncbi:MULTISPECIES: YesL family protein [unclassified Microbacterium]|uniref:YesL family protein n=1 Tax=unclassified Microbacterium TaxID=2609290 RepID=UPI00300FAF88
MSSIFAPDSALMRFLTRIADLMILNVLFIVTSLPIVTLGASLTALNFVTLRIASDTDRTIVGDYLRSFRQNFRQATLAGLVVGAFAAALAAWYLVVTELVTAPVAQFALLAVWYALAFLAAMAALYVFPYLASFEGTLGEVLRNARLLSLRHPLAPLAVLVLTFLAAVVTIFSPQATGYGLLWLFIGFAGLAYLGALLFARVFARYAPMPAAHSPEQD